MNITNRVQVLCKHLFPSEPLHEQIQYNSNAEVNTLMHNFDKIGKWKIASNPFFYPPFLSQLSNCSFLEMTHITVSNDIVFALESVMRTYPLLSTIQFQNYKLVKFRNEYIVLLPNIPCILREKSDDDGFDCPTTVTSRNNRSICINLSNCTNLPDSIIWNIFVVYEPYLLDFTCNSSSLTLAKRVQEQYPSWNYLFINKNLLHFRQ